MIICDYLLIVLKWKDKSKTNTNCYLFLNLFICFQRDRDSSSGGRAERKGETGSQAGPPLPAQRSMPGSNPQSQEIIP